VIGSARIDAARFYGVANRRGAGRIRVPVVVDGPAFGALLGVFNAIRWNVRLILSKAQ